MVAMEVAMALGGQQIGSCLKVVLSHSLLAKSNLLEGQEGAGLLVPVPRGRARSHRSPAEETHSLRRRVSREHGYR